MSLDRLWDDQLRIPVRLNLRQCTGDIAGIGAHWRVLELGLFLAHAARRNRELASHKKGR